MSAKEQKARAVADEHEFSFKTREDIDAVLAVLKAAAEAASGGLNGRISPLDLQMNNPNHFHSIWEHRGPGGRSFGMAFTVDGNCTDDVWSVDVEIQKFSWVKGALPGMKPSLGAEKQFNKFRSAVLRELAS